LETLKSKTEILITNPISVSIHKPQITHTNALKMKLDFSGTKTITNRLKYAMTLLYIVVHSLKDVTHFHFSVSGNSESFFSISNESS